MTPMTATEATVQPICATCSERARLVDRRRERQLQGLVGDYTLPRPYFVCATCPRGIPPVGERLGLGRGSLSPGLSRVASRLGLEDAFGQGVDVLAESLGVDVA